MTDSEMSQQDKFLNSTPLVSKHRTVEGRLWELMKCLAATEGNIHLFNGLKALGIGTNDVENFVRKQSGHKKVHTSIDTKVMRVAMHSKLVDACAHAKRLRQQRNIFRQRLFRKYQSKMKAKKVLSGLVVKYNGLKNSEIEAAKNKITHLLGKNRSSIVSKNVPESTKHILDGVSVFMKDEGELEVEEPKGLWICHDSLKFDNDELKLLSRGPKFMVREELSSVDFNVELEKMVAKKNFDYNSNKDDCPTGQLTGQENTAVLDKSATRSSNTVNGNVNSSENKVDSKLNLDELWEEHAGGMVYNMKSKALDLGNLAATRYKYNKDIFMPKAVKGDIEANHQFRRVEMKRVFDTILNDPDIRGDSNLSQKEIEALKRLKKRISDGSLVLAQSDKSKRFCALTRDQYLSSGLAHTKGDIELDQSQVKRIQNTVNDHTWWLSKITNIGSNWGHEKRMDKNLRDIGEQTCSMNLLIKDHKSWSPDSSDPPPSRPVISGNAGLNCHLSEIISLLIEPVAMESKGFEIDSTNEMLSKIDNLNSKIASFLGKEYPGSKNPSPENTENVDFPARGPKTPVSQSSSPEKLAKISTNKKSVGKASKSYGKCDIRNFGLVGEKTNLTSADKVNQQLRERVEQLRNKKPKSGVIPNIFDRLNAGEIVDKLEKNDPIFVSSKQVNELGKAQITDQLAIVGADVKSLYPSLKNVEIARLARHAILESKVSFENIDYLRASRYIYIAQ